LLLPGIGSLIKNKETAVAVAEAVLFKIYGEENIRDKDHIVFIKRIIIG
jgi:hypothetical protein